ncbi:MAG: thioredoxin-dependent thiol peroxidase [Planctomycetota bacterium]|jgi:peroxiredoxin Q/BCP
MAELNPGDRAPGFELKDQNGGTVKLSDFRGKELLIYFYPKAGTPYCTRQACSLRDHLDDLKRLGVEVVGISPDEPERLKAFDEKRHLGFTLLSDPDHRVAEAYGAWGRKRLLGVRYTGIIRSAFVVDEDGGIAAAFYKVSPKDTARKALEVLRKP